MYSVDGNLQIYCIIHYTMVCSKEHVFFLQPWHCEILVMQLHLIFKRKQKQVIWLVQEWCHKFLHNIMIKCFNISYLWI